MAENTATKPVDHSEFTNRTNTSSHISPCRACWWLMIGCTRGRRDQAAECTYMHVNEWVGGGWRPEAQS